MLLLLLLLVMLIRLFENYIRISAFWLVGVVENSGFDPVLRIGSPWMLLSNILNRRLEVWTGSKLIL